MTTQQGEFMKMAESSSVRLDLRGQSDRGLIELTLDGRHEAFEALMGRHRGRLYANMLRLSRSSDIAEEIVQDAFAQAYFKLDSFRHQSAFFSWLFRIAFNKYLGLRRKRRPTLSLEELQQSHQSQPIDPADSAESEITRLEDRGRVTAALHRLDPETRAILLLREIRGLSYDQIGRELNLKMGTVRSRLSRARSKLYGELRRDEQRTNPR